MKKKHGIVWWVCVGWWWYLLFAWWLYPIMHLVRRRSGEAPAHGGGGYDPRKMEQTMAAVVDVLRELGGSALQTEVKKRLPAWAAAYFEDAVNELYQNGRLGLSKDGPRVRLELKGA